MPQSIKSVKAENDPRILMQVRNFLKVLNSGTGKPIEQLSPAVARKVLTDAQDSVTVDYSGIEEKETTITQDNENVTIHIIKPVGSKPGAPVFVYIHGGGWVLGDYPTHRRLVRDLVVESGAVAVFPDYTPSPEARYPAAHHFQLFVLRQEADLSTDPKWPSTAMHTFLSALLYRANNCPRTISSYSL